MKYMVFILMKKNNNTGLFGVVEGSTDKKVTIRNFNLISGSITNESENAEVSNTGGCSR